MSTANTRLERHFDPDAVHGLKAASSRDLLVGGPNMAAQALVAGLVDEVALFVWPVFLVGATPHCRSTHASILSFSTSTDSAVASSTAATAFSNDAAQPPRTAPYRRPGGAHFARADGRCGPHIPGDMWVTGHCGMRVLGASLGEVVVGGFGWVVWRAQAHN